ncbi:peptide/nickel transport system permease protein [Bacillus sp. SORGH_AS 510]|uniref:ABC transporter permease n=1 Tax=Bacillus sp. SORGH_AS_0510 TaxID=3041771 RepID=UPI0027827A06|nr:ABC transporter permease [Bacillus sp. SORGH_AS_0510]MDQ1144567.1 peptide/nickel transport system permease protein [Bacillus sp. SORGH_AS_0510]
MLKYIFKRILQAIPLLFIISIICFTLIQLAPYDAVDAMTTPNMTQKTIELIKARYGLDQPAYMQYFYWVKGILSGEWGYSIVTHESITNDLSARIPNTILLVFPAYILALLFSIILGLIAGAKKGKLADKIIDGLSSFGIAIPSFWMAMILVFIFGHRLNLLPILGMHTIGNEESFSDLLSHMILPCTVLMLSFMPELVRYVRSSTIGQLSEDYVMVQQAYGANSTWILYKHVLRNVLLPIITIVGMSLPMLVTGAVVTETVFGWPGIGTYFVKAIQGFDYPVVMAIMLLAASLVIIGNLVSDILYSIVDPRIKGMEE